MVSIVTGKKRVESTKSLSIEQSQEVWLADPQTTFGSEKVV